MALTWADVKPIVRANIQDVDTVNQAIDDTTLLRLNNEFLAQYAEQYDNRIFWDPEATTGIQWAVLDVGVRFKTTAPLDYSQIYSVHSETGTGTSVGKELDRISMPLMRRLQESPFALQGAFQSVAFERQAAQRPAGNPDPTQVGKWRIYTYPLHPGGSTVNLSIRARKEPALMTGDASVYDTTINEAYLIADVIAAMAAPLMGLSPEFIQGLWSKVPERLQGIVAAHYATAPTRQQIGAPK